MRLLPLAALRRDREQAVLSWQSFTACSVLLSHFDCLVLAAPFLRSCSGCPLIYIVAWLWSLGSSVQAALSWESCPGLPVLEVILCSLFLPVPFRRVPFWLYCSSYPFSGCPLILTILSWLPSLALLSWQSCPGSLVSASLVLSVLSVLLC